MKGIGLCVLLIIIILIVCVCRASKKESYGTPLGQLAPYRAFYNECINQCERQDPNRRFLAPGNINCGIYCESVMTDLAQRGVPPESLSFSNSMTDCEKQCAHGKTKNERDNCKSVCFGQNEVAKWCKELYCPYSMFPHDDCMDQCIAVNTTNNNQVAWTWQIHG